MNDSEQVDDGSMMSRWASANSARDCRSWTLREHGERSSEPAYNVASGCSLGLNREHELLLVLVPSLDQPIGWGASRPASASGDEPYISASYGPKGLGRREAGGS